MRHQLKVSDADKGLRLDLFLTKSLPDLSRSRVHQLLDGGKVSIQPPKTETRAPSPERSYRLRGGEIIAVEVEPPAPLRAFPEALPLEILYEDDDLVAINKPAGLVVHIGAGVRNGTLVNALLHHFRELSGVGGELRPGIVHRLDKDTSGVLLVAKNDAAHRRLAEQFAGRTTEKHYLALVHGSVKKSEGVIRAPIARDPRRRTRMTTRAAAGSRHAESRYELLRRYEGFSLLDVRIITGRTHQVRVHLASIGHPVVGDTLYGAPARLPEQLPALSRNFLHAERIRFIHPRTGQPMEIRAPLPEALAAFLAKLTPQKSAGSQPCR